jgi:hypothetical protein
MHFIEPERGALVVLRVDRRQTAPYSPVPDSDLVLIEPRLRHRTPSAWMRFCTPFGDRQRWQHFVALGGSITLHWVAELIAFSNDFIRGHLAGTYRDAKSTLELSRLYLASGDTDFSFPGLGML